MKRVGRIHYLYDHLGKDQREGGTEGGMTANKVKQRRR